MLRQLLEGGNYSNDTSKYRPYAYFYAENFGIDPIFHKNIFLLLGTKWSDRPENQR